VSYISQHQPDLRPLSSRHHRSDHQVGHGVTTRHSHTLFQLLHSLLPVRLMLHDETTISFDHQVHERLTYSLALSWMIRSTKGSSSAHRSLAHSIFSRHSLNLCRSQLATKHQPHGTSFVSISLLSTSSGLGLALSNDNNPSEYPR
jgi:hypothetical protein